MSEKPPIFILGCPRSGTSLLRRLINAHSNIACPPETCFMVQLARVFEIERSRMGIQHMGYSEDDILEEMRRFFCRFLDDYAASKNKPRWAEKSCSYLMHAETIDRMFRAQPLYVAITRNPLDVCHSICEIGLTENFGSVRAYLEEAEDEIEAAAMFWRDRNLALVNFERSVGDRFIRIRYEDITQHPERIMKAVFEFLGEPWEPRILDYNEFDHDPGYEDAKVSEFERVSANLGRHLEWSVETRGRVLGITATVMDQLGYQA